MRIFLFIGVAFLLLVSGSGTLLCAEGTGILYYAAGAPGEGKSPAAIVRDFYDWYMPHQDPAVNRLTLKKDLFEPELFRGLTHALAPSQDEKGLKESDLAFDPFTNSQIEAEGYSLGAEKIKGETATVEVILKSRGASQTIIVLLQRHGDTWKIADLRYREDSSLLKHLKGIDKSK